MRWHRHLTLELIEALKDTFGENQYYADKVIERRFKSNKKWGSRDRKFFAESFYQIVRYWRKYIELAGFPWKDETQLSVKKFIPVFSAWALEVYGELPPWDEFSTVDVDKLKNNQNYLTKPESIEAYPNWIYSLGEKIFTNDWPQLAHALNQPAELFLRANQLKTTAEKLQQQLIDEGLDIECVEGDALRVCERQNVFILPSFQTGLFEVQDFGSQKIAPFLQVKPGMRVLDVCAGAGGKTLHLAALMKNKGKIIATDIYEWKLRELKKRAARAGVDIIERKVVSNQLIKRWKGTMDRLLMDVPCSGFGVFKRNPDTKWKLTPERIDELVQIQAEIFDGYSRVVKPGGKLVYSTCSLLPQENEKQVENFLASHPEWQLEDEQTLSPVEQSQDGFYMARLVKTS